MVNGRCTGERATTWLRHEPCDSIHLQLTGRRRFRIYPPSASARLRTSSTRLDLDLLQEVEREASGVALTVSESGMDSDLGMHTAVEARVRRFALMISESDMHADFDMLTDLAAVH